MREVRVYRYLVILMFFLVSAPVYAQSDLAFAQLAVGGNPAYETVLQIINEVEASNPIRIEVFQGFMAGSTNGTPMSVRFDGGPPASTLDVTLAPFQEYGTLLTGTGTSIMNGWLRVRSTMPGGKISGNLVFRQRSGGSIIGAVGTTGPQRFRQAIVQIDQREAGSDTGVAFANPDNNPVVVTLELFQALNLVASSLPVTLQPNQHYARLISEMFPSFGTQQGTIIISAAANRAVPCMALRIDNFHLTSIPVRPLGFSFQYTVTNDAGATVETGSWLFDMVGFSLTGTGRIETPVAGDVSEVTGSWTGTNFQFRYRKVFPDSTVGMVVFNGTSAGQESTVGSNGLSKAVTGKVTTIGADGRVVSINNFTAYHKFGAPPQ
jgi:hypothetical protein